MEDFDSFEMFDALGGNEPLTPEDINSWDDNEEDD